MEFLDIMEIFDISVPWIPFFDSLNYEIRRINFSNTKYTDLIRQT